jgi:hypothetical protein
MSLICHQVKELSLKGLNSLASGARNSLIQLKSQNNSEVKIVLSIIRLFNLNLNNNSSHNDQICFDSS